MEGRLPGGTILHTDYAWNKAGTRIRCTLQECLEVMDVAEPGDMDKAEELFRDHQIRTIRPAAADSPAAPDGAVAVELAALRILRDTLHEVIADLSHEVSPLVIQAKLTKVLAEARHAVALADGKIFGPGSAQTVASPEPETPTAPGQTGAHKPAAADEPGEEPATETAAAPDDEPEPATAEVPRETEAPTPEPEEKPLLSVVPAAVQVPVPAGDPGVAPGDRVLATFLTPRQGEFSIEATVVAGPGAAQLVVGSWVISTSGVRSQHLLDITVLAAAGEHDHEVKPGSNAHEHFGTGL